MGRAFKVKKESRAPHCTVNVFGNETMTSASAFKLPVMPRNAAPAQMWLAISIHSRSEVGTVLFYTAASLHLLQIRATAHFAEPRLPWQRRWRWRASNSCPGATTKQKPFYLVYFSLDCIKEWASCLHTANTSTHQWQCVLHWQHNQTLDTTDRSWILYNCLVNDQLSHNICEEDYDFEVCSDPCCSRLCMEEALCKNPCSMGLY